MEDQTLNPFRAPTALRQAPRGQPALEAVILSPVRWTRELPICLALTAIIFVAYWGVWNFDFVYFDDPGYVTDNLNVVRGLPLFKDFKSFLASIHWAFTAFEQSNWHPLSWLSHMLDVQIYGLNAGGHHVTNILFHVSNTLLLFWLLRRLTGRSWCSAAVAALFAVHPMHVESVAWVAERKDVLSTFLGLLTLLAYVRYTRKADLANDSLTVLGVLSGFTWLLTLICLGCFRSDHPEAFPVLLLWAYVPIFAGVALYAVTTGRYNLLLYCLIFVLYAVGLLAKPMLVTLPFVCLLLDFWPLNRFAVVPANGPPQRAPVERLAAPRRRAKRNQRLPARRAAAPVERRGGWSAGKQALLLVLEKVPLLALSAASAIITPYAQNQGGSMASTSELSLAFRLENSMQSYLTYISRMFWPGKMSVLYLLDVDNVNHFYTATAVVVFLSLTGLAIWGACCGRRYLAVGWFWYVGTLVPVIGIVQVGEQTHADRYTYIPYVGLFIMLAWGIADLIALLPQFRKSLQFATGFAMVLVLTTCVGWTKYQLQFWTDVETHLRHALTITPDNWNMLNNLGVKLWKKAQDEDLEGTKAEVKGDREAAKSHHEMALALKADAKAQWIHGITTRPTATDIHSNLGYCYSEAASQAEAEGRLKDAEDLLNKAEWHLTEAVRLKPISPRPHNNLGRVLLRRSQRRDADAREAEAKGKFDPAEAAKGKQLRDEVKTKRDAAIDQFEKAVELDPSLLEARLNLGQVYMSLNELDKAEKDLDKAEKDRDKAEFHYREILKLDSESVKDRETINNFSQAYLGLAQVALARKSADEAAKNSDEARRHSDQAIDFLQQSLARNGQNPGSLQLLAHQRFERGEFREGEKYLWPLLALLPRAQRRNVADQFGGQFETTGKHKEALEAWNFMAWALAASPDPHVLGPEAAMAWAQVLWIKELEGLPDIRDPEAAMVLAQRVVGMTRQQDPLSLDTLAAALAAGGQYSQAAQAAQAAIQLANSQGKKPLANVISQRLRLYQQGKPYRCDPDGSDRP